MANVLPFDGEGESVSTGSAKPELLGTLSRDKKLTTESRMIEIIDELETVTIQRIEENRKNLPEQLYGNTKNRDVFIDEILSTLPEKKKKAMDLI